MLFAAVALALALALAGGGSGQTGETLALALARSWARGDFASMYASIERSGAPPERQFASALAADARAATLVSARVAGRVSSPQSGEYEVPLRVRTRLFGTLTLEYRMTVVERSGGPALVRYSPALAFPGLRPGESLSRRTYLPRRATLLARDGSVLAETPPGQGGGPAAQDQARISPLGSLATAVLGSVGPPPASELLALEAEGVPAQATVGTSGLELALDARLRGSPGGELLEGSRVIATAQARAAPPVHTTVSPAVQQAAVEALGGQYGGVVAMVPASGEILGVAGIGLDGLQPPGSTFKMVTVSGVLSAGLATPSTVFPYATYATLDGVRLNNANGEECGGTLELAFAVSCNSVFSPLGVRLGAQRLVATAERFGFNHPPGLADAAESTLPHASAIQGELDVGSTAIGQGQVLATPLQMATVAATIADHGHRPTPRFLPDASVAPGPEAVSVAVAATVRRLMEAVVREGTGTAAAIPGVTVAGKTGTAELKTCSRPEAGAEANGHEAAGPCGGETEAANTDAWFAAFAPALGPRIAVCVMLVKDGAGGATAAPVARQVLEAALRAAL